MVLHFFVLKRIPHFSVHLMRLSRSCWSRVSSSGPLIPLYTRQSSAKRRIVLLVTSLRSFINNKKRWGPSTVPWGTPLRTFSQEDEVPLMVTLWCRWVRKDRIQCFVLPLIP